MNGQTVNIRVILQRLLRNPLLSDMTLELVIDYTIDFLQIVGINTDFEEKNITLQIENYRATLPANLYEINQVRDSFGYYRYSTSTFNVSEPKEGTDKTFFIQNNYIYVSTKTTEIEMSYQSIAVDEEGLPLLPSNANFQRALENYIKKERFSILYDSGKISDKVMFKVEQDYAWAVGSYETDAQKLSLSKAESFFNQYRSLIVHNKDFHDGFTLNGSK